MIPAFDLRLGNWITVRGKATYITGILPASVQVDGFETMETTEELHPIFLNNEILIKAGWEPRNKTPLYDKVNWQGFSYHLPSQKIMLLHSPANTLAHWLDTRIVFVHQLQNIFYYITGNELSIQL